MDDSLTLGAGARSSPARRALLSAAITGLLAAACQPAATAPPSSGGPTVVEIATAPPGEPLPPRAVRPRPASSVSQVVAPGRNCCKGLNQCKGMGACKTENNACKGMNACKGQGGELSGGECD